MTETTERYMVDADDEDAREDGVPESDIRRMTLSLPRPLLKEVRHAAVEDEATLTATICKLLAVGLRVRGDGVGTAA